LELLRRSGIRFKGTVNNKSIYSFSQRWEDRAWIIRALVELHLLGHELGERGEHMTWKRLQSHKRFEIDLVGLFAG